MLDTFGDTYLALNDLESALKADRESLAIPERLAKADPKIRAGSAVSRPRRKR